MYHETPQPLRRPMVAGLLQGAPPEEIGLIEFHHPLETGAVRIGKGIGVLADDDVRLFEPQDALRLEAEGLDPEVTASLHDRVPDMLPVRARHVNLIAQLSDEADAQNQGGRPGK